MMLESLSGIFAMAAATLAAAGEPDWVTYRSPSGFYSVDHPGDWKLEREENIVNITPGDESGAVTISAFLGKIPAGYPKQLVAKTFGAHQPTSPLLTVSGSGWKGIRQTFLDVSQTPHSEWGVIVARNAGGMVMMTWNEVPPGIPGRAPVYERILNSLRLSSRKR
jgi:hypothetical protein